ncbi:MAG: hypothetical protein Kow00124_08320 [Anaerolineae bacterium]
MTDGMKWTGFIATLVMVLVIPLYALLEPFRQEARLTELREEAVSVSTDRYAENCAICHGAAGEGLAGAPALNSEGIRLMDAEGLFKVIARGRDNTVMAPWAVEEGGVLTNAQIEQMVMFLQHADWAQVEARVAELGLTPPTAAVMEIPDALLAEIAALPGGDSLSRGLTIYAENCVGCHGGQAEGTSLAPALDTPELRATSAEELTRLISYGVPGTLMAGWDRALDAQQIADVVGLIQQWNVLAEAGLEMPQVEAVATPATPEMIAAGEQLFAVACTACHGVGGYGSPMAPALNNQTFLSETPDAAIYQIIALGVPGTMMPAWGGRLTDADINALVAYLRSLEGSAPPVAPSGWTPPGRQR